MIKPIFTGIFCLITSLSSATINEVAGEQPDLIKIISQSTSHYVFGASGNRIYSNGPLINSVGTGIGNTDESILQDVSLGLTTLGIGHQQMTGLRVSDEFTVERDGLTIDTIDFFAYQTNEQASTITEVNLQIWDGPPGQPSSQIIFGDTNTNIMIDSQFSGILRVSELDSGVSNNRQIAATSVLVGLTLDAGDYWLDWQSVGSGPSGPWAPPISISGSISTGNALRSFDNGLTYEPILDAGLNTPLGLPFILRGTLPPPAPVNTLSHFALFLLILLTLIFSKAYVVRAHEKITD